MYISRTAALQRDTIKKMWCSRDVIDQQRRTTMSVSSHIEQLKKKHQHLSDTVETLQRSPAATDAEIASMKKQKLAIKEEITKLSSH